MYQAYFAFANIDSALVFFSDESQWLTVEDETLSAQDVMLMTLLSDNSFFHDSWPANSWPLTSDCLHVLQNRLKDAEVSHEIHCIQLFTV